MPDDKYMISVAPEGSKCSDQLLWQNMQDLDNDQHLKTTALLNWLRNYVVYKIPGKEVNVLESHVYFVDKISVETKPEWMAVVYAFDVWSQERQVIYFKLSPK